MKQVKLVRLQTSVEFGTFGVLLIDNEVFCVTLEPYDFGNIKRMSCIPSGQYKCERYSSHKYKKTFRVMNTPNRTFILFHSGNVAEHTSGCILLAQHYGKLGNKRAVLNSGITFNNFMKEMSGSKNFTLTVKDFY
jgi:hypothetical protein